MRTNWLNHLYNLLVPLAAAGLALLIGLVVGTYSSAFVATPLLLLLEQRFGGTPPQPKRVRARTVPGAARLQDSGAVI